jgi:hypothetical protein
MLVPSRAVTDGLRDGGQMTGATGKLCFSLAARRRKIGPKGAILLGLSGIFPCSVGFVGRNHDGQVLKTDLRALLQHNARNCGGSNRVT